MLFWLKKVIGFWLMPLPLSLGVIVCGAVFWRFTRCKRLGRGLVMGGLLWLGVCSNQGVGTWLVRGLENRFAIIPELPADTPLPASLARCQFIAVLGGGHTYVPGWPATNELSSSALSRIVEAVRIAHRLPGARIIVSGPPDPLGGPTHARVLADAAVSLGVARDRIIEISTARDTEDEAAAIHAIAGKTAVALVTSAWHMPRAMALCRRQELDVAACPSDYVARIKELKPTDFLQWNVGGLERSTKAFYEWLGLSWARLRGKA
ncbi:MAG TPA: ElyC/SanA/YdcF family protein [Rariglobus sp.]|jgi:uncharacterized SAM-binding protein YcdF (DUF218 family)|nr:ElyC/SanA/YdcF family protein [Rariglobus sp.]